MTLTNLLNELRSRTIINQKQHAVLTDISNDTTLSLFAEIRMLFYAGALSVVIGAGWLVRVYFSQIGPLMMISALTAASIACFVYCFLKAEPYRSDEAPPPTPAFDYVLYVGCALLGLDIVTIETQFRVLQNQWDLYLVASSAFFSVLAYRFDNRLVLSLAITTLASWCGIKMSPWRLNSIESLYPIAVTFGLVLAAVGAMLHRRRIKRHFLDTYLNFAAILVFTALLSGSFVGSHKSLTFFALFAVCAATTFVSLKKRRFVYLVYAMVYGYVGVSGKLVANMWSIGLVSIGPILLYFIVSSSLLATTLFVLARKFREDD